MSTWYGSLGYIHILLLTSFALLQFLTRERAHPQNITFQHDEAEHQLKHMMDGIHRTRRSFAPQSSTANTQCMVFMDADARFFNQWAGPCLSNDTTQTCFVCRTHI